MALDNGLEAQRKRLLWRASRRGIKEMDIIVGGFASVHVPSMDAGSIAAFEEVLNIPDQDLLAYATGQAEIPETLRTPMLTALLIFKPTGPT
jgi:antitoxin CptB